MGVASFGSRDHNAMRFRILIGGSTDAESTQQPSTSSGQTSNYLHWRAVVASVHDVEWISFLLSSQHDMLGHLQTATSVW